MDVPEMTGGVVSANADVEKVLEAFREAKRRKAAKELNLDFRRRSFLQELGIAGHIKRNLHVPRIQFLPDCFPNLF